MEWFSFSEIIAGSWERKSFACGNIEIQTGIYLFYALHFFHYITMRMFQIWSNTLFSFRTFWFTQVFLLKKDTRESLVVSEKKVRQLEVQVQDEQTACANSKRVWPNAFTSFYSLFGISLWVKNEVWTSEIFLAPLLIVFGKTWLNKSPRV